MRSCDSAGTFRVKGTGAGWAESLVFFPSEGSQGRDDWGEALQGAGPEGGEGTWEELAPMDQGSWRDPRTLAVSGIKERSRKKGNAFAALSGFHQHHNPACSGRAQGPYYRGVGADKAYGRGIVEVLLGLLARRHQDCWDRC